MNTFIIFSIILVVIILAVGLILTIAVGNSRNTDYSSGKSISAMLWIYIISIPFIIILTIIAIFIFY